MDLESAIPEWLRKERTVPAQMPPDFKPSFELYTSRFPKKIKDIVMAVIGAQYPSAEANDGCAIATISSFLAPDRVGPGSRPAFHEAAAVTDNRGFYNIAVFVYWPSRAAYEDWAAESGFRAWWAAAGAEPEGAEGTRHGWFLEVFLPTADRLETVFITAVPEGASHMRESLSGPIREHVYWGSMRDRLPVSQIDELAGETAQRDATSPQKNDDPGPSSRRVRVPGRKNLVVIRSGQDWSTAPEEERRLYVESMQPPLVRGMEYLRDHGGEVGCLSCRFMEIVDPATAAGGRDRTFALAFFDELASLERWSREHRTHLAIFGELAKYAKSLSLFHEVLVLEPEQQVFEYIGCHRGTGMLSTS